MVAQRDRHQPGARGVRARRCAPARRMRSVGNGAHRQVVVARPAEAAQVRAAAHHLHEEARAELGVGREDAGRRRIQRLGGLQRGLSDRSAAPRCPARHITPAMRAVVVVLRRRRTTGCRSRAARASRRSSLARDRWIRETRRTQRRDQRPRPRPRQSRRRTAPAARGSRTSPRRRSRPAGGGGRARPRSAGCPPAAAASGR